MRSLALIALVMLSACESAADRQARTLAEYQAQNDRDIAEARHTALSEEKAAGR